MHALAIGIDMGGTSIKLGVCRGADIIFKGESIPTSEFSGPRQIVAEMTLRIRALQKKFKRVTAVGVGVPGFVEASTGLVHELTNVPGWRQVYLARDLKKATGLPAVAENDANCMGLAERHHGAARGIDDFVAITLGTGVGGAVFIDGRLYRGPGSGAGEVGQMSIAFNGVRGPHGNTGALERYVGNRQVADRAARLYRKAGLTRSEDECAPAALAAAARRNDPVARQVWDEFTTRLATGLCNVVWLLNPEAIVIGGGIAQAGDLIFKPLRRKMNAQLALPFRSALKVIPAQFGNEAGIVGAAALALSTLRRRSR